MRQSLPILSGAVMADPVRFQTRDGVSLSGLYYPPAPGVARRSAVLLCPATGIRQDFYAGFARWLSSQGRAALTFDYRGIGASRTAAPLRACTARKQDWGEQDMPAALEALLACSGETQADLIGHSAGGQLIGLMPNHHRLRSAVLVSGSSGYVWKLQPRLRYAASLMLALYMPLAAKLLGYVPTRRWGWGEDLPSGVARQWARWCLRPGYVANSFGKSIARHYYDDIRIPLVALYASDDPIATPANVADLLRLFSRAPRRERRIDPAAAGVAHIGHNDWFRSNRAALWPMIAGSLAA